MTSSALEWAKKIMWQDTEKDEESQETQQIDVQKSLSF